jgi:hypothetical protein
MSYLFPILATVAMFGTLAFTVGAALGYRLTVRRPVEMTVAYIPQGYDTFPTDHYDDFDRAVREAYIDQKVDAMLSSPDELDRFLTQIWESGS